MNDMQPGYDIRANPVRIAPHPHGRGRGFRALHPRKLHASILELCEDSQHLTFEQVRRVAIEAITPRARAEHAAGAIREQEPAREPAHGRQAAEKQS